MDWGRRPGDRGLVKLPSTDSPVVVGMALGNVIAGHPAHRASGSEIDCRPGNGAQVVAAKGLSNNV